MAKLLIRTAGLQDTWIELKLGRNRVGRGVENDFQITHPSVSKLHCELLLGEAGVTLRDLQSTNGTFVDGKQVTEAILISGQVVRLGEVELLVDTAEVKVAIPRFVNPELPAAPVVGPDGSVMCQRHPHSTVSFQCTFCREVMCDGCVHRLQRKGGRILLLLCPICSNAVEPIGVNGGNSKKKSLLTRVAELARVLRFTK